MVPHSHTIYPKKKNTGENITHIALLRPHLLTMSIRFKLVFVGHSQFELLIFGL